MDQLTYTTALHVIKDVEQKLDSLGRDLSHDDFSEDQDPFAITFFKGCWNNSSIELAFGDKRIIAAQIAHFLETHSEIDKLVTLFRLQNIGEL